MAPARARRTTRAWPAKTIAPAAAAAKAPAPEAPEGSEAKTLGYPLVNSG